MLLGKRDPILRTLDPRALLTLVLAPFAAMLIQMAVSRSREYEAIWNLFSTHPPLEDRIARLMAMNR